MGNSKSSNPSNRRFEPGARNSRPYNYSYNKPSGTINNPSSSFNAGHKDIPVRVPTANWERLKTGQLKRESLNTVQRRNEPLTDFVVVSKVNNNFGTDSGNEPVASAFFCNENQMRERNRNVPKEDDAMKCPNCKMKLSHQIFLCESGHSTCQQCLNRLPCCQVCRKPFTTLRNTSLEALISKIYLNTVFQTPCVHVVNGCNYVSSLDQVKDHQDKCLHKVIKCPKDGCSSYVRLLDANQHLTSVHSFNGENIILNKKCSFGVNLQTSTDYMQLLNFNGHHFIYRFRTDPNFKTVKWLVQKCDSSDWLYVLVIVDTSCRKRSIVVTDVCRFHDDSIQEWHGTILPMSVIRNYLQNGTRLTIKLYMRKRKLQ